MKPKLVVLVLLLVCTFSTATAGAQRMGEIYDTHLECLQFSYWDHITSVCLEPLHADTLAGVGMRDGIVVWMREWYYSFGSHPDCIYIMFSVANSYGDVDTLTYCSPGDSMSLAADVPVGAFIAYRLPESDAEFIQRSAVTVVDRRPWCVNEDCIYRELWKPFSARR